MPQDPTDIVQLLRADVERRRQELVAAENALREYEKLIDGNRPSVSVVTNQFRGKRLVNSVCEYLEAKGEPASYGELIEALLRGGAHLGQKQDRYLANLKVAITMNSRVLDSDSSTVRLKEWKKS